jgi:hypothetical protein
LGTVGCRTLSSRAAQAELAPVRPGAGIALDHDRATRRVLEPPGTETIGALAPAMRDLLADERFRAGAEAISNEIRGLPRVDEAVTLLQAQASRAP